MSSRIRFFRETEKAQATREFLVGHGLKTFIRERSPSTVKEGEEPYGFDVYILRDEDLAEACKLLEYEFGTSWGEAGGAAAK